MICKILIICWRMCHRQNDLIRGTKVIIKYGISWLEHINFKFLSPCKNQRIKFTAKHISVNFAWKSCFQSTIIIKTCLKTPVMINTNIANGAFYFGVLPTHIASRFSCDFPRVFCTVVFDIIWKRCMFLSDIFLFMRHKVISQRNCKCDLYSSDCKGFRV